MSRPTQLFCLGLLTMFASQALAAEATSSALIESVGVPSGFDELTRERTQVVDLYFGGRRIGDARVTVSPGYVRFERPQEVVDLLPILDESAVLKALATDLPANAARVCREEPIKGCGALAPQVAELIYDEDRFRVDLFINPKLLRANQSEGDIYLAAPEAHLSLTNSTGFALSGSSGSAPIYNVQNRTIVGFGNGRVRLENSVASGVGPLVDTMVAEVDRRDLRYSGGLFWAPGLDLTGQRRILGAGFGTQFDTRSDRESLRGTPLIIFLPSAARVDILVDGRLVGSSNYEAGNNILDTSSLPAGNYNLSLRIHDQSGGERVEQRFFAKSTEIAPVGRPIYFGYAGLLANTRHGKPVAISKVIFYHLGTARRLGEKVAVDASVIGTSARPLVEVGGWLILPAARVRAAGLASVSGDWGGILQVMSGRIGDLSLNFDLRHVFSHDGRPLIPLSSTVESFGSPVLDGRNEIAGSYTQASGSIGYQIGSAYVSVIGALRKDRGLVADYSIGPSLNWPLSVQRFGMQIVLQADAQITRSTTSGYVGAKMLFNRGSYTVSSSLGSRSSSGRAARASGVVGDTTAHFAHSDDSGLNLALSGGATRELETTAAHADAVVRSNLGTGQAQFVHTLSGDNRTQYGLSFQTGVALSPREMVVGGRNLTDSAMVISVAGPSDVDFDVLIDGQSRGHLKGGQRLPIFLEPYRSYSVRVKPLESRSLSFDTAAREFTLFPGNVQSVVWQVEPLVTIFGRAVRPDGQPVTNAVVTSKHGMGQSNEDGYFQIETAASDQLAFETGSTGRCTVDVALQEQRGDFARLGKVLCK